MSRLLRASILLLLLASCGGGRYSAPRNLDDACAILRERPKYHRAMKATERKWGVPVAVQMAVIHQESKFIGNAKTPHRFALGIIPMGRQSSAYGYSQALDGTWEEYQREEGGRAVRVRMTLTAPGCGMGDILVDDVRSKLEQIPTVIDTDIELVFDPPWNQSLMSDVARLETGMF